MIGCRKEGSLPAVRTALLLALIVLGLACSRDTPRPSDPDRDRGIGGEGGRGPGIDYGSLKIEVHGLPGSASAGIILSTPDGQEFRLDHSTSFEPVWPGTYHIQAKRAVEAEGTIYVTDFQGASIDLEAGQIHVEEIRYERLPYQVHINGLMVPWRGKAELRAQIFRDPDFDNPLTVSVRELSESFSASPSSLDLAPTEPEARFVIENSGPLVSVEPRFGLTLIVDDGFRSMGFRFPFSSLVLVTSEADEGPGSLRDLLSHADEIPHPRRVYFANHVRFIQLRSPLLFESGRPLEIIGHEEALFTQIWPPDSDFPPSLWLDAGEEIQALRVRGRLGLRFIGFQRGRAPLGGCILNEGELSLHQGVWLAGCAAEAGGAIANAAGARLEIERSRLTLNTAREGGALFVAQGGSARITGTSFFQNQAEIGGAVLNEGELELLQAHFARHYASLGGALVNLGKLSMSASSFSENESTGSCGALAHLAPEEARISGSDFIRNRAQDGGAICAGPGAALVVEGANFEENRAAFGGALLLEEAELGLADSAFVNNRGEEGGGALASLLGSELEVQGCLFRGNAGQRGGAILTEGRAQISRSSFLQNEAEEGGAISSLGLLLENSSLAFNRAGDLGGALSLREGLVDLRFNTLVKNEAPQGGGIFASGAYLSMGGNILAQNEGDDIHGPESEIFSEGYNLVGVATQELMEKLVASDRFGDEHAPLDPKLLSLSESSLPFFPLQGQSAAVDAVPLAYCEKFLPERLIDQRGRARPRGEACDAGAIEMY